MITHRIIYRLRYEVISCFAFVLIFCESSATLLPRAIGEDRSEQSSIFPNAFEQNKRLGRGVNILGYDPLWKSRSQAKFQAECFRLIHEVGFNHVRINLHPFRDSQADGSLSTDYWTTLDWVIQQSLTNKLAVILDFHEFLEMGKNPSTKKGRFLGIWRYIAERYKDVPSEVYFEILNEPNEKLTPALWNQYFREALTIVRKTNPKRTIIVGPGQWNSIDALEKLDLPKEDHNLIVTVHFYNPFDFTHQGAPWTDYKDKTGILWSGTEQEREAIIQDLDRAQTWSKKHSRPIYLGEFGVYDQAEISSRVRYLNFVARQAEKMGWSWAYWQFDSNFLLYDIPKRQWVKPVLESLIPSGPLKASNKMNNLYAR